MDTYEELINIIKTEPDLEEFLTHESKWEYAYNLSLMRRNVLDWYDFEPEARLLEIGGECGAVTGLFCNRVREVCSVDVDEKACEVNRVRNGQYENLKVLPIDSYDGTDIPELTDKSFGYVVIIGELTEDRISFARKYVRDGGQLIVAGNEPEGEKMLSDKGFQITEEYGLSPDHIFPLEIRRDGDRSLSYVYICELKSS